VPVYDYACECGIEFDLIKKMSDHTKTALCSCGKSAERVFNKGTFFFIGESDWNNQTYNHGLGCKTRSDAHARQIAKERGLVEVGNENPTAIGDTMEKDQEKKRSDSYDDILREKVYE
jgi:putative FmdB family regulatory protein